MTKKLDSEGLRAIVDEYDLFFIDIWGVVHDGIKLHEEAIKTLDKIEKARSVSIWSSYLIRRIYEV